MKRISVLPLLLVIAASLFYAQSTFAQTNPALVPVSFVVTAEPRHGADVPGIGVENLTVYQDHALAKVTDCVPLRGDRAGLDLYILLDDSRNINQGTQLDDLRRFIVGQPATTKIGIAYMQTGGPNIVQDLTSDHVLAANALHVPLSNLASGSSPYLALSDLIDKWTKGDNRKEILMISNGLDTLSGNSSADQFDLYVDSAISKAERSGIIVFTITASRDTIDSSRGQEPPVPGRGFARSNAAIGRNSLARIAEETGGESYYYRSSLPISFSPYLKDANRRLNNQYLVTFLAQPKKGPGLQSVKIKTDIPRTKLMTAERVYVPAAQ